MNHQQQLIALLGEHGELTLAELQEKSGLPNVYNAMYEMERRRQVYQPRKNHWAVWTEEAFIAHTKRQLKEREKQLDLKLQYRRPF